MNFLPILYIKHPCSSQDTDINSSLHGKTSLGKSNHFSKKEQCLELVTTAVALKHYSSPFSLRGIDLRQRVLLHLLKSSL